MWTDRTTVSFTHSFVHKVILCSGYAAWPLIWHSHSNKRDFLCTRDKTDGIYGGPLPSFDSSGVSRTRLVVGFILRQPCSTCTQPVVFTVTKCAVVAAVVTNKLHFLRLTRL